MCGLTNRTQNIKNMTKTEKIKLQLEDLAKSMSKLIGQDCTYHESDFGGRYSIWIKGEGGALTQKLIGFAKWDDLLHEYYTFQSAWYLAKNKFENK